MEVTTQYKLIQIGSRMYGCSDCGRNLRQTDKVYVCADCGAVICERCVLAGGVEAHVCEEDEFEFDDDCC